jgi:two-component system NtrC family response regulator
VRELENRIKRAMIMSKGGRLTADDLGFTSLSTRSGSPTLKEMRETVEKQSILEALAQNQANITYTATALGISRATLHDLLTKYAIRR